MDEFKFIDDTTKYRPENAYAMGRAADLAYEAPAKVQATTAEWGFPRCRCFNRKDTQAFLAGNDKAVILAFRGTEPKDLHDWMTDADVDLVPDPWGQVHDGFSRALSYIWQDILAAIPAFQDKGQSLWVTGHSLGAALATLAVTRFRQDAKPVYGLYTYGQPRTGNRDFADRFNADFQSRTFRIVNQDDIVTRVPMRLMNYSHVGTYLYLNAKGEITDDMASWYRFLDCAKAAVPDLLDMKLDALADHSMSTGYLPKLKKNVAVNPFR